MIEFKYVPAFNVPPGLEVVQWSTGEGATFFYEDKNFDLDRQEFEAIAANYAQDGYESSEHIDTERYVLHIHGEEHRIPFNHLPVLIGLGFLVFSRHFTEKKQ